MAQRGWMQEHAGAVRHGRIAALEMRDVVTQSSQLYGRGNSADAVADDGDPQSGDHSAFGRMLNASGATGVMPLRGGSTCGV